MTSRTWPYMIDHDAGHDPDPNARGENAVWDGIIIHKTVTDPEFARYRQEMWSAHARRVVEMFRKYD